jgi:hypothetical protein
MDPKFKAKGRSVCALKIGIREAERQVRLGRPDKAMEACQMALKRSERMENA